MRTSCSNYTVFFIDLVWKYLLITFQLVNLNKYSVNYLVLTSRKEGEKNKFSLEFFFFNFLDQVLLALVSWYLTLLQINGK